MIRKVHGLAETSQLSLSLWNCLSGSMDFFSTMQKSYEAHHKCVQNVTGLTKLIIIICVLSSAGTRVEEQCWGLCHSVL